MHWVEQIEARPLRFEPPLSYGGRIRGLGRAHFHTALPLLSANLWRSDFSEHGELAVAGEVIVPEWVEALYRPVPWQLGAPEQFTERQLRRISNFVCSSFMYLISSSYSKDQCNRCSTISYWRHRRRIEKNWGDVSSYQMSSILSAAPVHLYPCCWAHLLHSSTSWSGRL